eukprot:scaffold483963_cov44-Prasinocladus_malaysianus.AAC.2
MTQSFNDPVHRTFKSFALKPCWTSSYTYVCVAENAKGHELQHDSEDQIQPAAKSHLRICLAYGRHLKMDSLYINISMKSNERLSSNKLQCESHSNIDARKNERYFSVRASSRNLSQLLVAC